MSPHFKERGKVVAGMCYSSSLALYHFLGALGSFRFLSNPNQIEDEITFLKISCNLKTEYPKVHLPCELSRCLLKFYQGESRIRSH